VRKAAQDELDWINKRYDEVGFVHSNYDNELIGVAHFDGKRSGIGRLVRISDSIAELGGIYVFPQYEGRGIAYGIVGFLLNNAKAYHQTFCIPFGNLGHFYGRYGFKLFDDLARVPEKIKEKYLWCGQTYQKETLLMVKEW